MKQQFCNLILSHPLCTYILNTLTPRPSACALEIDPQSGTLGPAWHAQRLCSTTAVNCQSTYMHRVKHHCQSWLPVPSQHIPDGLPLRLPAQHRYRACMLLVPLRYVANGAERMPELLFCVVPFTNVCWSMHAFRFDIRGFHRTCLSHGSQNGWICHGLPAVANMPGALCRTHSHRWRGKWLLLLPCGDAQGINTLRAIDDSFLQFARLDLASFLQIASNAWTENGFSTYSAIIGAETQVTCSERSLCTEQHRAQSHSSKGRTLTLTVTAHGKQSCPPFRIRGGVCAKVSASFAQTLPIVGA